jgi:SAM-dependent methyltransferase
MLFQPHYVRDYRRMVRSLNLRHNRTEAMELAIGGGYESVGLIQAQILREEGLPGDGYLVDVGCGSGRTAYALRDMRALKYLGTDVVPDLIEYAAEKVRRPDWRFLVVDGLTIPERDESADIVTMFSVLTHLSAREGRRYLAEAVRVVRPGGKIILSFLDTELETHRRAIGTMMHQIIVRMRGISVKNVVLHRATINDWARQMGLIVQFFGPEKLGQSYCVFSKPGSAEQSNSDPAEGLQSRLLRF